MTFAEYIELTRDVWNTIDDGEMCWRLRKSGYPLNYEDRHLIAKLFDDGERASVYDLHRLNMLCQQAVGWMRAQPAPPHDP